MSKKDTSIFSFCCTDFFLVKNNIGQEADIQAALLTPLEPSFQFYFLHPIIDPLPFPHCGRVNYQPPPLPKL